MTLTLYRTHSRARRGLTLLEAMILMTILAVVALGFGIGLQASARVPGQVDLRLAIHTRLVEKIEELTTLDFPVLAANSGLSDTVTIGNQTLPRTVTVTKFDADGNGSLENDIVEVEVAVGWQSLKTRVAQR
jgi:hypothetical protein